MSLSKEGGRESFFFNENIPAARYVVFVGNASALEQQQRRRRKRREEVFFFHQIVVKSRDGNRRRVDIYFCDRDVFGASSAIVVVVRPRRFFGQRAIGARFGRV